MKWPSGPNLSRARISTEPVTGEVVEWKGGVDPHFRFRGSLGEFRFRGSLGEFRFRGAAYGVLALAIDQGKD